MRWFLVCAGLLLLLAPVVEARQAYAPSGVYATPPVPMVVILEKLPTDKPWYDAVTVDLRSYHLLTYPRFEDRGRDPAKYQHGDLQPLSLRPTRWTS